MQSKEKSRFKIKQYVGYSVILLTLLLFWNYLSNNREVFDQLRDISLYTILFVALLYGLMTILLALLYKVMAEMCGKKIPNKENLLLTMYSSVVNFFGPLQSGPGFRTLYLKKKYNINIAKYVGVSLLYYVMFGTISGLLLIGGLLEPWFAILILVSVVGLRFLLPIVRNTKLAIKYFPNLIPWKSIFILAILSFSQVLLVAVIYYTEISSLNNSVTFGQALIYTGAANLALFVSLTPGALGFRESFLLFSRDLHHVDQATIINANIIDRGVYLLFLGLLILIIISAHSYKKFRQFSDLR